jgi:DNA-binding LacI/PurR family transcriptional regulator
MRRTRKKEITMNDVAVACGVSYQTVSRAINGMEDISEETRSRILKMVDKLGYRPNMAARHLASRQSSVIGIVTSDISFYGATQVMLSAGRTAREAGYALMLAEIQDESLDEIRRAVNDLCAHRVAGILLFQVEADFRALRDTFRNVPFVGLNSDLGREAGSVFVDQESASEMATNHLITQGHSAIACIRGPQNNLVARRRYQGWLTALKKAGCTPGPYADGDFSAMSGFAAATTLVAGHRGQFTAVVAANDQMALGAIRAFEENNVHVPLDVSVVGFDDMPEAGFFRPPLSTVKHDLARIGHLGVRCLLSQVNRHSLFPKVHSIKPVFVERLSTTRR